MEIGKFEIFDINDKKVGEAIFDTGEFFDLEGNLVGKLKKPASPVDLFLQIYDGNNKNIGMVAWEIGTAVVDTELVGHMGSGTEILDKNYNKVGTVHPRNGFFSPAAVLVYFHTTKE